MVLIIVYFSVTGFIIIPICLKKSKTGAASTILFVFIYHMIAIVVAIFPVNILFF
jgi:hypothetical protein